MKAETLIQVLSTLEDKDIIGIFIEHVPIVCKLANFTANFYQIFSRDLCLAMMGQSSRRVETLFMGGDKEDEDGWKMIHRKKKSIIMMHSFELGFPSCFKDGIEYIKVSNITNAKRVVLAIDGVQRVFKTFTVQSWMV